MNSVDFVRRFGGVYEHSSWVAERVSALLGNTAINWSKLPVLMADVVDNASGERQLALIRAHPDLAGRAQVAGELTQESTDEQSRAGLDQCTADEYELFQTLNKSYKEKFGFPFVMAVRKSNRQEILAAFAARLENDYDTEFETALQEIHTIATLRLAQLEDKE
jgi:OHCU decarboxylase